MKTLSLLAAVFFFTGCALTSSSVAGKYGDYTPSWLERRLLRLRFHRSVNPIFVSMFYLRQDGTYVMGYCNCQVAEAGRYSVEGDSILFYDRYHFRKIEAVADEKMAFSYRKKTLYFTRTLEKEEQIRGVTRYVNPLRKDCWESHYGFLRGEEMSLDSLRRFYVFRPIEEQMPWIDSMVEAVGKTPHNSSTDNP